MAKRAIKIEVRQARNKQWFYRVRAANGRILESGETYTRKASAVNAALRFVTSMRGRVVVAAEEAGTGKLAVLNVLMAARP